MSIIDHWSPVTTVSASSRPSPAPFHIHQLSHSPEHRQAEKSKRLVLLSIHSFPRSFLNLLVLLAQGCLIVRTHPLLLQLTLLLRLCRPLLMNQNVCRLSGHNHGRHLHRQHKLHLETSLWRPWIQRSN